MALEDSPEIVKEAAEAVSFNNIKAVGEQGAILSNLAMANAVSHQQAMNHLLVAATAKAVQLLVETSPSEGGTDIAGMMQLIKAAQTTPPVTP
jgi:hypothetical protein